MSATERLEEILKGQRGLPKTFGEARRFMRQVRDEIRLEERKKIVEWLRVKENEFDSQLAHGCGLPTSVLIAFAAKSAAVADAAFQIDAGKHHE